MSEIAARPAEPTDNVLQPGELGVVFNPKGGFRMFVADGEGGSDLPPLYRAMTEALVRCVTEPGFMEECLKIADMRVHRSH